MKIDKLVKSVIASEAWQSCCCNLLKTKDCFVTPFLAMTVFRTFYEGVKIEYSRDKMITSWLLLIEAFLSGVRTV